MPRPSKGKNTFLGYQEEKQARRESLISDYLKVLKKGKAQFKYVTDLAKMVAVHISQAEGKECNKATLLRNLRYKALLLSFMADEMRPGAKNAVAKSSDDPGAQAQLTQLQLANRNLIKENQRLKAHIVALPDAGPQQAEVQPQAMSFDSAPDFEERFVLTCQVVLRILENLGDFISVDTESMRVLDLSKRIDNVIADERLAQPFVEWLQATRTR
jgi:hypothetical protein